RALRAVHGDRRALPPARGALPPRARRARDARRMRAGRGKPGVSAIAARRDARRQAGRRPRLRNRPRSTHQPSSAAGDDRHPPARAGPPRTAGGTPGTRPRRAGRGRSRPGLRPHPVLEVIATQRKIVHVDMDAFYASVEQRDDPSLRGRPVVVAWRGNRSVVCAASYEARKFGVRSAMPALRAERLCPQAVFVPPDFPRYKAVSRQVREIFARHTDLIEPLSLDEAYLDVSKPLGGPRPATVVAESIRAEIRSETGLTASAGVAPNKFIAKIASDQNKPDGLCVVRPREVAAFLAPLPVSRL